MEDRLCHVVGRLWGRYVAFMYFLAGLLVLELLRFHLSKHLRQEIDVSLEEYRERLLDQRYIHER